MPRTSHARTDRADLVPRTSRGLVREVTYLHADEEAGLVAYAKRQRCSQAEAIRRAVREFLKIED